VAAVDMRVEDRGIILGAAFGNRVTEGLYLNRGMFLAGCLRNFWHQV
jgi:hypothetical protein